MATEYIVFICLCLLCAAHSELLCKSDFCRTYEFEVGCVSTSVNCEANNATHSGIWMPSPTECNCCNYCLPVFVEGHHCSLGGPGLGTTVGRCGDGLTCVQEQDGNYCRRMETECHSEQDEYDVRHESGEVGALEQRKICDDKGNYGVVDCVPTQTCFCQSEEGERIFGEVLYVGTTTIQNTPCACSRMNNEIRKNIGVGVPYPVIGPRCTSDGNFNPVQCLGRKCYCVNKLTGKIVSNENVDLDSKPITELSCYDSSLDLFPKQSEGEEGPYNYTTPCFEDMQWKIDLIKNSSDAGFIVDFFNTVPECLPDGTYGRVLQTANGSKICVNEHSEQIGDYEAQPGTLEYENMDCKCAQTELVMESFHEKPVCCKNGNFREIQCRRGKCRCVNENGRQKNQETADVTLLSCYTENWRNC